MVLILMHLGLVGAMSQSKWW